MPELRLLKRFLLYINFPPPFLFLAIIMKQLPGARVKQFIKTKGPVYIWYIYICIKTLITIWAMIGSQLLEIQKSINLFVNHRISWYFSFLQTNSLGKSVLSKFSVKRKLKPNMIIWHNSSGLVRCMFHLYNSGC